MPITDSQKWNDYVSKNNDSYGGCCVNVAREVMRLLDEQPAVDFDPATLITQADTNVKAGGITGFMAGAVAHMVSVCHSRGKEFQEKWNVKYQIGDEGKKATETGATLNPALMSFKRKG